MDNKLLAGLSLMGMVSLKQITPETMMAIVSSLSLLQLLLLTIRGSVLIDWVRLRGWKGKLPVYIIKCPKHGYQLNYPTGYNKALICPKCFDSHLS